jgi:hypothetical protein
MVFISAKNASVRPGSEGFARKKHRREKNHKPQVRSSFRRMARPIWRPDFGELPSGLNFRVEDSRAAGRPNNGITLFSGKEHLTRLVQEMIRALWFFSRKAPTSMPGNA